MRAVELAKCFGSEESGAFVNGILGKIANPDKKVAARKASSRRRTDLCKTEVRFQGKGSFQKGGGC